MSNQRDLIHILPFADVQMIMSQVWQAVNNSQHQENLKDLLGLRYSERGGLRGRGRDKRGRDGAKEGRGKGVLCTGGILQSAGQPLKSATLWVYFIHLWAHVWFALLLFYMLQMTVENSSDPLTVTCRTFPVVYWMVTSIFPLFATL